ncbi:MAG: hypothetical protein V3S46_04750 [Nitrospinota bacterium]
MDESNAEKTPNPEKEVHELYKHYRGAVVALSATIIAISGSIIYWLTKFHENNVEKLLLRLTWLQLLFYAVAIASALFIQFFHFLGYFHLARFHSGQSLTSISNEHFTSMDKATKVSFWTLIVGLGFSVVFYVVKYW